jgi:hypothetical protein
LILRQFEVLSDLQGRAVRRNYHLSIRKRTAGPPSPVGRVPGQCVDNFGTSGVNQWKEI